MIGNPKSEVAADSYRSWELAIEAKREQMIRAGTIKPRPYHPGEVKWAEEGPRPISELDTAKFDAPFQLPNDCGRGK